MVMVVLLVLELRVVSGDTSLVMVMVLSVLVLVEAMNSREE